jgi:hypothetical protein
MIARINKASSYKNDEVIKEITTLEDLKQVYKQSKHELIISFRVDNEINITIYDDYIK